MNNGQTVTIFPGANTIKTDTSDINWMNSGSGSSYMNYCSVCNHYHSYWYHTNWCNHPDKTEQAFMIVQTLVKEKIIDDIKSADKFVELVKKIINIL